MSDEHRLARRGEGRESGAHAFVARDIRYASGCSDAQGAIFGGSDGPGIGDGTEVDYRAWVRELLLDEYQKVRAAARGECDGAFEEARRVGDVFRSVILEVRERHWLSVSAIIRIKRPSREGVGYAITTASRRRCSVC